MRSLLAQVSSRLAGVSDTAPIDAQVLLAHLIDRPRAWVLAHPEAGLTLAQQRALDAALARLEGGEPLPYVLGHWEFYGLDFTVTPDVLIPRPETELLVEMALADAEWQMADGRALDLGTGSGCIAVALAVHAPAARFLASDCSLGALAIAQRNAHRHAVDDRIQFLCADLFSSFASAPSPVFSLVTANLPYIPTPTLHTLNVFGKEPTLALDGGPDGLALIRQLLTDAPRVLAPRGLLLLEIEASQGDSAKALARAAFPDARARLLKDLAGHDRLLEIRR
jgi:release factor glutamine methyltransferase